MYSKIAMAAAAFFLSAPLALAQSYTYIVHGIPGRDINTAYNPSFPIDVSVNGECLVKNALFGNIVGPIEIPSGQVTFLVYQANSTKPCSGPNILGARAGVAPGQTISVVAGETTNRVPTLNPLLVDLTPVALNSGRVVVYHQADAPKLDVVGVALTADQSNVAFSDIGLMGVQPGEGKFAVLPATSTYVGRFTLPGTPEPVYGSPVAVQNRGVEIVYLVGSTATGSITEIGTLIPNVY
jgi:hypothetical protein